MRRVEGRGEGGDEGEDEQKCRRGEQGGKDAQIEGESPYALIWYQGYMDMT